MSKKNGRTQIYVDDRDRQRLERLGRREHRRAREQLTLIIDEACAARGLNLETVEPIPGAPATCSRWMDRPAVTETGARQQ